MPALDEKAIKKLLQGLAEKYCYDKHHSSFVEKTALKIYDSIRHIHNLGHEWRVLLQHAAILHDIGSFIDEKNHHKHTRYIIRKDSTLEVYPKKLKKFMSLIAFNHREKLHKDTFFLSAKKREAVLKASAILRVADALAYPGEEIVIKSIHSEESEVQLTVEKMPSAKLLQRIEKKQTLFYDVFELKIVIKLQKPD